MTPYFMNLSLQSSQSEIYCNSEGSAISAVTKEIVAILDDESYDNTDGFIEY